MLTIAFIVAIAIALTGAVSSFVLTFWGLSASTAPVVDPATGLVRLARRHDRRREAIGHNAMIALPIFVLAVSAIGIVGALLGV